MFKAYKYHPRGNGDAYTSAYTYDAFGRRTIYQVGAGTPVVQQYDETGMLLVESGDTDTNYVYLNGTPIAAIDPGTAAIAALHTDNLGTPQAATDSSKSVVWSGAYAPFGAVSPTASITMNLRFPGQYADSTGFYYNMFRDYIPAYGRYLESDPIGLEGGFNTYNYAMQNPYYWIDPWGLLKKKNRPMSYPPNMANCPWMEPQDQCTGHNNQSVDWQRENGWGEKKYHNKMHVYKERGPGGQWHAECSYRNGILVPGYVAPGTGTPNYYPDGTIEHLTIDPGGPQWVPEFVYEWYWYNKPNPSGMTLYD